MNNEEVVERLRVYIEAERACRMNPHSWRSCHPDPETPEGREYARVSSDYQKATAALWMATDFEYAEDGFRDVVWKWRYWSVMARKCCWYQRFGTTFRAVRTMRKLQEAESRFVEVCGLTAIYRTAASYIEEHFPNLKRTSQP